MSEIYPLKSSLRVSISPLSLFLYLFLSILLPSTTPSLSLPHSFPPSIFMALSPSLFPFFPSPPYTPPLSPPSLSLSFFFVSLSLSLSATLSLPLYLYPIPLSLHITLNISSTLVGYFPPFPYLSLTPTLTFVYSFIPLNMYPPPSLSSTLPPFISLYLSNPIYIVLSLPLRLSQTITILVHQKERNGLDIDMLRPRPLPKAYIMT